MPDSTTNRNIEPTFAKCYQSGTCDETGRFSIVTYDGYDGTGEVSLPTWISFSASGIQNYASSTQTITITPTYENMGFHTINVVYETTHGNDLAYTALTFYVKCEVTGWTAPTPPVGTTYIIYEQLLAIDIGALGYV